MVRCGGLGYTIDIGKPMGSRISAHDASQDPASRSRPRKDYMVAGWASVNEGTEGPPVWELVEKYVAREEDREGRAEHVGQGRRRIASLFRVAAISGRLFLDCTRACRTIPPAAWYGSAMDEATPETRPSRRRFLTARRRAGAALAGSAGARRQSEKPAAERAGVDARARRRRRGAALRQALEARGACHPPRRAMADREPRVLGQLHAAARARRHHHAERALLRAPSRRHRRDRPGGLPADRPRPRRQAADLHARRPQALPAREPHPLPRMRGEFRHGVARRAAQRLPVHPRHGALRRIHRRAAARAARRGRREAEREMAARRRRGLPPR